VNDILYFNVLCKRVAIDLDKDIHLVVDFMESRKFHGRTPLEKGVNPLVSQRLDDVFQGLVASLGGFLVLGYP
jgi:hypothetical protein